MPVILANPAAISAGQTVTITLSGVNTGAGVTVGTVTVANATTLSVQLTAAVGLPAGTRSISVTTGTEGAVLPNGRTVP